MWTSQSTDVAQNTVDVTISQNAETSGGIGVRARIDADPIKTAGADTIKTGVMTKLENSKDVWKEVEKNRSYAHHDLFLDVDPESHSCDRAWGNCRMNPSGTAWSFFDPGALIETWSRTS